jgi:chromosome segregation ATPase
MVDEPHTATPRQSSRRRKSQFEASRPNGSSASVPTEPERPMAAELQEKAIQLPLEPRAVFSPDIKNLADAVRAIVSPLQDMFEREITERRILQAQADKLLTTLATAQVELAEATGNIRIGHAKLEAAEARAAEAVSKVVAAEAKVEAAQATAIELQRRVDALRLELARPPARRWWPF